MMILKRIGVLSLGKMEGGLGALMGLIIGAIFSLVSLIGSVAGMASGENEAAYGFLFGIGAIIIIPIVYGIFGFLAGMLIAFLYNLVAKFAGGIEFHFEHSSSD